MEPSPSVNGMNLSTTWKKPNKFSLTFAEIRLQSYQFSDWFRGGLRSFHLLCANMRHFISGGKCMPHKCMLFTCKVQVGDAYICNKYVNLHQRNIFQSITIYHLHYYVNVSSQNISKINCLSSYSSLKYMYRITNFFPAFLSNWTWYITFCLVMP